MPFLRTRFATTEAEFDEAFNRLGAVYVVRDDAAGRVKIGYSRHPVRRRRQLQVGCSGPLRTVAVMAAPIEVERTLHEQYAEMRLHGEWFDDRDGFITDQITKMNRGDPIATSIWEMVPGKWVFHEQHPGGHENWSALEYVPA